jgi:small subunit ribosomal protein S6
MFLVDSAQAAADWDGTLGVIETILKRADAEVVSMRKWSERRLAYEIDHKARGTYILCYFKADGRRIAGLEKDVQLSEKVMRVLVLGTEKRPPEVIETDMTGVSEEQEASQGPAAEETVKETKTAAAAKKDSASQPAAATESDSSDEPPASNEEKGDGEQAEPQPPSEAGSQAPPKP